MSYLKIQRRLSDSGDYAYLHNIPLTWVGYFIHRNCLPVNVICRAYLCVCQLQSDLELLYVQPCGCPMEQWFKKCGEICCHRNLVIQLLWLSLVHWGLGWWQWSIWYHSFVQQIVMELLSVPTAAQTWEWNGGWDQKWPWQTALVT